MVAGGQEYINSGGQELVIWPPYTAPPYGVPAYHGQAASAQTYLVLTDHMHVPLLQSQSLHLLPPMEAVVRLDPSCTHAIALMPVSCPRKTVAVCGRRTTCVPGVLLRCAAGW
jgi:hypothetical protein